MGTVRLVCTASCCLEQGALPRVLPAGPSAGGASLEDELQTQRAGAAQPLLNTGAVSAVRHWLRGQGQLWLCLLQVCPQPGAAPSQASA